MPEGLQEGGLGLQFLKLDNNKLTGRLPDQTPPSLYYFSARNNSLSGDLPNREFQKIDLWDFRDNAELAADVLPFGSVVDTASWSLLMGMHASCAGITIANKSRLVAWDLDPSYDGYARCECDAGYAGSNAECTPCPRGTFMNVSGQVRANLGHISSSCFSCMEHGNTTKTGATRSTECQCDSGYELSDDGNSCNTCPLGKRKLEAGNGACEPWCDAGYELSNDGCKGCSLGFSKSEPGIQACALNPAAYIVPIVLVLAAFGFIATKRVRKTLEGKVFAIEKVATDRENEIQKQSLLISEMEASLYVPSPTQPSKNISFCV